LLDETRCILNEKMMPDVTIMVPELDIDKKMSKPDSSMDKLWWNKKLPDLAPINPPIPDFCLGELLGASPYLGIPLETSHLYHMRCKTLFDFVGCSRAWCSNKGLHKKFNVPTCDTS
jgi:hypothetical protein